jgi:outer membrane protein OmpA-like peptidoglycan-associated protein
MEDIRFEAGQAILPERCHEKLDRIVAWLEAHPVTGVGLDGHADEPASEGQALAVRRVQVVRDALVTRGVNPARISVGQFGERPTVCGAGAERCRERARRVEVLVVDTQRR